MKKSIILLAAMASLMAGCLSDDYPEEVNHTDRMVSFSGKRPSYSRADKVGKDAADELGGSFLVYGFKGDGSFAAGNTQEVFDYYLVNYSEGSDYTTTTNTDGWEYVGTPVINSLVADIAKDGTQTPKYWDYGQAQYGFVAFSKGTNTGNINIEDYITDAKIDYTKISSTVDPVYTLTGDADKLKNFFVSDLHIVEKENYGQPVKLNFRTNGAKVRIGIYETIPGYSVKDVKFKQSVSNDNYAATPALTSNATEIMYGKGAGTLGVFFPGSDTKPHFKFTTTEAESNYTHELTFGNLSTTGKEKYEADGNYLYRTSSNPSYTNYVTLMPAGTTQNLQLTAKYTLVSLDGRGETIDVGPIAVSVPAQYANWLPNFAYTYLFKITDVGSGLYPITFDAAEIVDAGVDLDAESTINRPAINAYQEGVTIGIGNNKIYTPGDIFVTVHDQAGEIVSPLKVGIDYADGANINLFKIVMSNSVNPSDVTEPLLAQCFNAQYPTVDTYTYNFDSNQDKIIMMKRVNTGSEHFTGELQIPADQSQYSSHNDVAGAKFTAFDNTMYAIQYRDPNGNYVYKIITIGSPEQYYMMNYTATLYDSHYGCPTPDIWYTINDSIYNPYDPKDTYDTYGIIGNIEENNASWGGDTHFDTHLYLGNNGEPDSRDYSAQFGTGNNATIEGCLLFNGPVTDIYEVFDNTRSLKSISLPSTLQVINDYAFSFTQLENVVLPSGVKSIGDNAYDNSHKLQYLTLNEGLETIGLSAFEMCENLGRLVCPSTLKEIGSLAFNNCYGMTSIYLNEGLKSIGKTAFHGCGVQLVKIPQTVETIGYEAFAANNSLEQLQLPVYCGDLGDNAFATCEHLKRITLDANGTTLRSKNVKWGKTCFAGCPNLTDVSIPSNVVELGEGAFSGCSSLVTIKLNNNIATMGGYVFQYCDKLKNVNIPTALSVIEANMFDGCKSLETITIPANITEIGDRVFKNCSDLKTVIFEGTTPPMINDLVFIQAIDEVVSGEVITHYYPAGLKIYVPDDAVDTYKNKFKEVLLAFKSMIYSIKDLNE